MASPPLAVPTPPGLAAAGYRVLCDSVVGGLLFVFAVILFGDEVARCVAGDNFGFPRGWLLGFTGLVLLGSMAVLFFRGAFARRLAIGSMGFAIVQIAATQGWLFIWRPSTPSDAFGLMTLISLVPAVALALLYVDYCFVARTSASAKSLDMAWRLRARRAFWLVATGLIGMGTVIMAASLAKPLSTQARSLWWPTTTAVITSSEFVPGVGKDPTKVKVEYAFEVEDVSQTGRRVTALPQWFGNYGDQEAERMATRLAPGVQIPVAYHPTDPSCCLLFPGISGKVWVFLLGCGFYPCAFVAFFLTLLGNERSLGSRVSSGDRPSALIGMRWLAFGLVSHLVAPVTLVLADGTPSHLTAVAAWLTTLAATIAIGRWLNKKQAAEAGLAAA